MDEILQRALHLWGRPLPPGDAALEAFRAVYADPVTVNGQPTDVQVLVDRSRMLQDALADITHTVHEEIVTPGRRAFAFTITGRHTGPLTSPFGELPPTDRPVAVTGLDIFTVDEDAGRVTAIWAVADWPALLQQTSAD